MAKPPANNSPVGFHSHSELHSPTVIRKKKCPRLCGLGGHNVTLQMMMHFMDLTLTNIWLLYHKDILYMVHHRDAACSQDLFGQCDSGLPEDDAGLAKRTDDDEKSGVQCVSVVPTKDRVVRG